MGRGQAAATGNSSQQLRLERGQVRFSKTAVDNWARIVEFDGDFQQARQTLLETIDGLMASSIPPAWMTAAKPGVAYYAALGDWATALIVPDGGEHFRWQVRNITAPRRRPGRKRQTSALTRAAFSQDDLDRLGQSSGAELEAELVLTRHLRQRLAERAGLGGHDIDERLRQAIITSGSIAIPPPPWADGGRGGGPVLLVELDDRQLALPLARNSHDGPWLVISTCVDRLWAEADLADTEARRFSVKDDLLRRWADEHGLDRAKAKRQLVELLAASDKYFDPNQGPVADLPGGRRLGLRAIAGPDGGGWLAESIIAADS